MNIELLQGDCCEMLKNIQDESIDLTVTSPPYDNLRDYGGQQEFTEVVWKTVLEQLLRVTKPGGCVVWIVNDAVINRSESGTSFRQALYAKECGFLLHDTMIWDKKSGGNTQSWNRYFQAFEYMFVFSKGAPATSNLLCDRKNDRAGLHTAKTNRNADGTLTLQRVKTVKEYGRRFNIWHIPPMSSSKEATGHPAQFPVRLVKDHIVTWSNPGDTVLDPFAGSGTTGVAAVFCNRNFIGMELDPGYFQIAKERIEKAQIEKSELLELV